MYIKEGLKWTPYGTDPEKDKLVDSNDGTVRMKVAKQGYGLDKLVDSDDMVVRMKVAEQGYGLDKLIDDKSMWVRAEVAKQGYGLDKLIDDDSSVREKVAEQGYGLDKLVNDNIHIRIATNHYLEDNNLTIEQWRKDYPDKCFYTDEEWEEIKNSIKDPVIYNAEELYDYFGRNITDSELGFIKGNSFLWYEPYQGKAYFFNTYDIKPRSNNESYKDWLYNNCDDCCESTFNYCQGYYDLGGSEFWELAEKYNLIEEIINYYNSCSVWELDYNCGIVYMFEMELPQKYWHLCEPVKNKVWEDNKNCTKCKYCEKNICTITNECAKSDIIKDFIYKINDSQKLQVVYDDFDSIEEFFSIEGNGSITIRTRNTNEPIFNINKQIKDNKASFKFIADITNEDGDNFRIKTAIKNKEHLVELIEQTVEALEAYPQFHKYIDDLKNCL